MMTSGRIEVEPLSDQRWEKIERSLVARLEREALAPAEPSGPRRGRHRWWTLAAAALIVLLGVTVFVTQQRPQELRLDPSRIATGAKASHLVLLGLSLDVEPNSAVVVGPETSQGRLVVLDRGSMVCEVAPRTEESPLVVQAGAARVRVVGTRFSVTRLGEGAEVKVTHGVVEVAFRGERRLVKAGESWASPVPLSRSTHPVSPTPSVDAPSLPSVGSSVERGLTRSRRDSGTTTKRSSPSPEPARHRGPSRQDLFEQATALERSDPAQAARLYRELEAGADSWGQHALYARGRLEALRGNHAEARRVLTRYLEQFSTGGNAEDARAVLKRLK